MARRGFSLGLYHFKRAVAVLLRKDMAEKFTQVLSIKDCDNDELKVSISEHGNAFISIGGRSFLATKDQVHKIVKSLTEQA